MSTIEIREPPKRRAFRGLRAIALLNRALVAALMLGGVLVVDVSVFDDPPFVERLAFDNPSEYQIDVALSASGSTDTLPVGVAVQRCITGYESIIDQGSTWTLHFSSQGRDGGETSITRDQLERDGWTYRVPDSVIDRLRAQGAPVPPDHSCPAR